MTLAVRAQIPPMSDEEHALVAELVRERFGLQFPAAHRDRVRFRLRLRLEALSIDTFIDYYRYLRLSPRADEELGFLAEALTNGETFFFREWYQLRRFFESVAPASATAGGGRPLRVLSAGCSSGEEAYSLAMAWEESGLGARGAACEIHAVDVNAARIRQAETALYGGLSLRATSPDAKLRYFVEHEGKLRIKDGLKDPIRFRVLNLLELGESFAPSWFDAVFCRNVLIYFDEAAEYRVYGLFHELLRPGGALFLGHSESLLGRTRLFAPRRAPEFIYYVKADR
jgi:chemotaxis protein methyltransferase CheR